mgnify:CR=1 FL=1
MEGGDLRVMSTIEDRVVAMKFDGNQFLNGVNQSLTALDKLNKGLKMQEGVKGFSNLGTAAQAHVGALKNIESGVQRISDRFKAMGIVGMTALSNITNQAIFAGQNMLKSLTVEPILDGFREYETNLNSIQTILSNTQAAGTKLKDVTAALDELNHYSDQTIYNFSEMARNIGTFTAAGVGLKPAVAAIKGIANLAALSGSNSQQASTAMYQLSQAISSGRVSLEDWNSVVNAGMGGTVFQRALAQNAEKMGTLSKGAVALKGDMKNVTIEGKSFRESITAKPGEESWLTSEVLTRTLAQFTGDLSDAELAAQGFNKAEIKAIQAQAKMAQNAATEVKTLSQLLGTIKESVGSGWAATWKTIFGDFPEAKKLFTNVNNVLGGYVTASANARNKVLGDWKALGGRTAIINAISNSFKALVAIATPIKNAFREIFPATTGKQLAEFSKSIERFTKSLIVGGSTANNIKRTFAGVFAVLGIGWEIIKQVVKTLATLFGIATEGSGGILKTTASIGDFLVALHKAVAEGEGLSKFFSGLGKVLAVPIKLIKAIAGYFGSLFKDLDSSDATKAIDAVSQRLAPFGKLGEIVAKIWGKIVGILDNVGESFSKIGAKVSTVFGGLGEQIVNAFTGLDYKDILATFNTGLFAGLVLLIKKFVGNGGGITGIFDNIGDAFENLTGALGAMQNTLRAATLLQIAAAVGILAVSMNVLSKIDAAGLARASAAITVMFAQLLGSLALFEKVSGFAGFAKMPFVAGALILLAVAIDILAIAVAKLAKLDWNGLAKGLTGVTVLLAALVGAVKFMPPSPGLISTAVALVVLSAAIKLLASSVTDLSGLSWEEMARGLVGVGALLGALTLFTKFAAVGKGGILQGVGLVLLAAGIKILASAVKDLSGLSWEEIVRGLAALAGALALVTAALVLIPPTAPLGAASVLIVAISLGQVADALEQMGSMSWGAIGKGLVALLGALTIISLAVSVIPPNAPLGAAAILIVALALGSVADVLGQLGAMDWSSIGKSLAALAGAMLIIVVGVSAMTGALAGAAAMLVVSAALAILAPVLVTLGSMSWSEIGKGLLVLAAAFVIIGVAGALLAPVVPALIGLGAAIVLLGAGAALAGVGILALSAGLAALAITGAAGTAALVAMVAALIGLIPAAMQAIGRGLILFAEVIATAGPAITKALITVLNSLITAIAVNAPKIANQLYQMLLLLVQTMNKYASPLADAGAKLVVNILNGLARNVPKMANAATNVVVAFINAISKNQGRVIDAGVKMIISFVNGVANAIRSNSAAMNAAGRNLGSAIIQGMVSGISGGIGAITSKAREIASSALNAAKSVLGIASPSKEFEKIGKFVNDGFRKGLDGNKKQVTDAFNDLKAMLADLRKDSSKDVDTLEAKLKKLRRTGASKKTIAKTKASLAQAKKEEKASTLAYNELTKRLKDESSALGVLADKYDNVTAKLDAAKQTLEDAKKTRDDYNKSINDQFGNAIDPTGDTKVEDYIADLKKQLEDTKTFTNTIQQLRAAGLNDETYKDLLTAGPSALPFMKDLLASGKAGIDEINSLGKQLDAVSSSLAQSASSALYQAAVDSAAGIVKGLQNQQAAIEKQMDKIADAMVKSIKKKLGIKSPSKVFGELGKFSAQGLARGLDNNAGVVVKSAESMADTAIVSLRKSLSNVDKMVAGNVDLQPAIRPVLDLTDIRKNAGKLGSLLPNGAKMTVSGAYSNAVGVATQIRNNGTDGGDGTDDSRAMLSYTQNIYSPKAVSTAELYRNTKNQLSTVKGALST